MVFRELLSLLNISHLMFVLINQKTFFKCYQCITTHVEENGKKIMQNDKTHKNAFEMQSTCIFILFCRSERVRADRVIIGEADDQTPWKMAVMYRPVIMSVVFINYQKIKTVMNSNVYCRCSQLQKYFFVLFFHLDRAIGVHRFG